MILNNMTTAKDSGHKATPRIEVCNQISYHQRPELLTCAVEIVISTTSVPENKNPLHHDKHTEAHKGQIRTRNLFHRTTNRQSTMDRGRERYRTCAAQSAKTPKAMKSRHVNRG